VGAREQRVDATPLVGGDPPLEETGVGAELCRQPLDRLARGPGLPALDLADVLLREAVAGELGLGQAGRHTKLAHALAQAVAWGRAAAGIAGQAGHAGLPGRLTPTF